MKSAEGSRRRQVMSALARTVDVVEKPRPKHHLAARTQKQRATPKSAAARFRAAGTKDDFATGAWKLTSADSGGATCDNTWGRHSRRTLDEQPDGSGNCNTPVQSRRNTQCCTHHHNRRGHSRRSTPVHSRRNTRGHNRRNTPDSRSNRSQDRKHTRWRPSRRSPHRRSGRPRGRHPNPSHPWLRLETAPSPHLGRSWPLLPKRVLSFSWFAPFRGFSRGNNVEWYLKV